MDRHAPWHRLHLRSRIGWPEEVADRENVLQQLEGILNAGYEGIGWMILRGRRQLDRQVKETLKRGLVEYIYGPEAPNSGDELTFFVTR